MSEENPVPAGYDVSTVRRARQLRAEGMSVAEIARATGYSISWVKRAVKGEPVPARCRRPNAKDDLRERARQLRVEGRSVPGIAAQLGVARSTVWLWTSDLPVPPAFRHGTLSVRQRAAIDDYWSAELARRQAERAADVREAFVTVGVLSDREVMLIGAALYWAEGCKSKPWRRSERLTFVNSDPSMIRIFMRWLRLNGVSDDQLRLSLQIHESADVTAALAFWAGVVGIPSDQFAKTTLKRHNPKTVRKNTDNDQYHGCLAIGVRQGRSLYRRTQGLWEGIVVGAAEGRI